MQVEVILKALDLGLYRSVQQVTAVPARYQLESEFIEDRAQNPGISRKLVAQFNTGIARIATVPETDFKRCFRSQ